MLKERMRKRHNVRDVAKLAGVSVATVSRVINNAEIVTERTRTKVENAIEALQFVPSSSARAINSGRTHLVGALVPTLDNAIFARFIDAIEARLNLDGLSLIVGTTNYDPDQELEKTQRLLNIGVEGLIVSGIVRSEAFSPLVKRYRVPVVSTSYFDSGYEFPTVGYDNMLAAKASWDHLVALGHRRIVVLSGPSDTNERTRARLRQLHSASKEQLPVVEAPLDYASAAEATLRALEIAPDATALLCLSDVLAQGAMLQLAARGFSIPKDISVIGMDDLPSSASFHPPLTSIHLPVEEMGEEAANAMSGWIETGIDPEPVNLGLKICVRGSTAKPRKR